MKRPKKKLLFICVHNSARSQMAEAIYNSKSRRSYAISAGNDPANEVNPFALKVLIEIGIMPLNLYPKKITKQMIDEATRIFTMGCIGACPATTKFVADWGLPEPTDLESFRKVRDLIVEKVKKILKEVDH